MGVDRGARPLGASSKNFGTVSSVPELTLLLGPQVMDELSGYCNNQEKSNSR
jgi:hypothetical protein